MDHIQVSKLAKERLYVNRTRALKRCQLSMSNEEGLHDYQNVPFVKKVLSLQDLLSPLTDLEQNMAIDIVLRSSVYEKVQKTELLELANFDYTDQLIKELLLWFKTDFFTWVNKPLCEKCGNTDQNKICNLNAIRPYKAEHFQGKAYIVERYRCSICNETYEFPRYNDICTLLKERRGRCGEWNNCFVAILRSLDIDTRLIWNAEDHVWCEYYSIKQKRWIHLDSCENAYDQPFLYNEGWNKKMSYTFAIKECYILDVSEKYLCSHKPELQIARDQIPDKYLKIILASYNISQLLKLTPNDFMETTSRLISDFRIRQSLVGGTAVSKTVMPRQSGKGEWTKMRGEDG